MLSEGFKDFGTLETSYILYLAFRPSRHRPLKVLLDDALDLLVAAAAAGTGARGG
jgi:hypothetical protein